MVSMSNPKGTYGQPSLINHLSPFDKWLWFLLSCLAVSWNRLDRSCRGDGLLLLLPRSKKLKNYGVLQEPCASGMFSCCTRWIRTEPTSVFYDFGTTNPMLKGLMFVLFLSKYT